jgi:DNA primase
MLFDIASYVESRLSHAKHSGGRTGQEMTALCPRCEKSGKFYINIESGRFVCFSCDFRGRSVVWLVAEIEGLSTSEARAFIFRQSVAIRRRDSKAVLRDRIAALRPYAATNESTNEPEIVDLPKTFRPVWDGKKWDVPLWLKEKRGIFRRTARAWGLGYCRVGRYAGRLIIPIECPNGSSFTARDMTEEQEPKYLNPQNANHSKLLVGWNLIPTVADLVICEGPLDAVKLWQHHIPALALGGKELHSDQLELLGALSSEQAIIIMLDPDAHEAPFKVAEKLHVSFDSVYIASLPEGVDPGDSTAEQAHRAVDHAKRWTGERLPKVLAKINSAKLAITSRH